MNATNESGDPRIGDVVGGCYRLQSLLGADHAGVSFRATHVKFGREVLVRIVSAEVLDAAGGADRLVNAARVMTDLESEHVAHLIAGGHLADGGAYLVFPWFDGCTLADLLEGGSLPMEVAIDYVLQACEALAEMHGRGIVHRDLRPESLYVFRQKNGRACVKLLCNGTGKVGSNGGGIPQRDTHSAAYESPEQMSDPRTVDERADIWSLGVVLFQLLTRKLPFGDGSVKEVLSSILMEPRPSASDCDSRLPTGLDEVLRSCMRQRRAERTQNVETLAKVLVPYGGPNAEAAAARIADIARDARSRAPAVLALPVAEASDATESESAASSEPESMAPIATTVRPPSSRERGARTILTVANARRRMARVGVTALFIAAAVGAIVSIGSVRSAPIAAAAEAPMETARVQTPPPEVAFPVAAISPATTVSEPIAVPTAEATALPVVPAPALKVRSTTPHRANAPRRPVPRLSTTVFPESGPMEVFGDRK